ncbi:hypothetical protein Q73A0000_06790 [Kaistella flava (ex Peng et al. 2021)]|uniref:LHH domain-containing protein n=1 Tax=Kaistella flava (ex Peng et al. 2021) TaxID=2038776 RepID=A0A7M2Y745_9FLAO|nr:RHS repeat-associated core domain-containing protein [Kaistella flava (ex Peng et al. 2021)]QOW10078.1 hypothetical protein Q73A0000_06740 [Kaistella flava (ex Peng et al. 2021)]QOW10087.1 hypothetical protein Q73A0000_06790 [Kaistella flava (ex Peng et al. 2021)]
MYDYGARMYMPDIGRWGTIDPRSAYTHEAYSYVWNNPISFSDPTGMEGVDMVAFPIRDGIKKDEIWTDSDGSFMWNGKTWTDIKDGSSVITQVSLVGKSKNNSDNSSSYAAAISAGIGTSESGVGLFILLGTAVWWTLDQATKPTLNWDTRIDPMMHSPQALNSEADDTDVNGITVPDENKVPRDSLNPPSKPGNAPTFKKDGKSVEIHHEGQNADGPFSEMHPNDHRGKGNYSKNHPKGQKPLTKGERIKFNNARQKYWKKEYPNVK